VGLYRARAQVLGDIIDSSPVWVGPPVAPYTAVWNDRIHTGAANPENGAGAQTYPQFLTAVDQIRQAPQNRATNGAVIGVFAQARQRIQKAIEEVLLGKSSTKDALDTAAADVNAAIDKYNKTTK